MKVVTDMPQSLGRHHGASREGTADVMNALIDAHKLRAASILAQEPADLPCDKGDCHILK